jgi:hypothetical protein
VLCGSGPGAVADVIKSGSPAWLSSWSPTSFQPPRSGWAESPIPAWRPTAECPHPGKGDSAARSPPGRGSATGAHVGWMRFQAPRHIARDEMMSPSCRSAGITREQQTEQWAPWARKPHSYGI